MFKSRREARDWCTEHHAGSPIREVGANSSKRATKPKPQELECPSSAALFGFQSPARLLTYRC